MPTIYTSLQEVADFEPCKDGFTDLRIFQKKLRIDNEPIALMSCTLSNSFNDVCWLLGKRQTELPILLRTAQLIILNLPKTEEKDYINKSYYTEALKQKYLVSSKIEEIQRITVWYRQDLKSLDSFLSALVIRLNDEIIYLRLGARVLNRTQIKQQHMDYLRKAIAEYEQLPLSEFNLFLQYFA